MTWGTCWGCRTYQDGRQATSTLPGVCPSHRAGRGIKPLTHTSSHPAHIPTKCQSLSSIPGTPIVPATSFSKADWNIPEMPSRAKGYVCVSFTCITWLAGGCLLPRGAQPKVIGSTADNPSFLLLVIIHICLRPTYFHLPPFLT